MHCQLKHVLNKHTIKNVRKFVNLGILNDWKLNEELITMQKFLDIFWDLI